MSPNTTQISLIVLVDTAMLFWAKLLVEPFQTATFSAPPKNLLVDNFDREIETVANFCQRASSMSSGQSSSEFLGVLLLSLKDKKVGLYSRFHDYAVYKYGYGHDFTIRLAYM